MTKALSETTAQKADATAVETAHAAETEEDLFQNLHFLLKNLHFLLKNIHS